MAQAYLRSLTAKWLSRTHSESPSSVLSLMQVSQARRQPGTEWARTQTASIDTILGHWTGRFIQQPGSARKVGQSLISYWAQ
jgi:hypothetical protein